MDHSTSVRSAAIDASARTGHAREPQTMSRYHGRILNPRLSRGSSFRKSRFAGMRWLVAVNYFIRYRVFVGSRDIRFARIKKAPIFGNPLQPWYGL